MYHENLNWTGFSVYIYVYLEFYLFCLFVSSNQVVMGIEILHEENLVKNLISYECSLE